MAIRPTNAINTIYIVLMPSFFGVVSGSTTLSSTTSGAVFVTTVTVEEKLLTSPIALKSNPPPLTPSDNLVCIAVIMEEISPAAYYSGVGVI